MKKPMGFNVLPHDWAGHVTLEFSVFSEAPVNYVRYRSPLKSREFDLYMPPELFGDQSRPERIWITLEKPEGVRTIQGFSQLPHRWSGPPGTVEFSVYDRSLEGKGSSLLLNDSPRATSGIIHDKAET